MNDRRNTGATYGRRKHLLARLSIWSLKRHDHLIAVLRMSMWSFSAVVLLAAVVGRLDLQTALLIIAFGGLSAVVLLTGLVLTRRSVLLSIDDPDLRAEAHQALRALIRSKSKTTLRPAYRTESDRTSLSGEGGVDCLQGEECRS